MIWAQEIWAHSSIPGYPGSRYTVALITEHQPTSLKTDQNRGMPRLTISDRSHQQGGLATADDTTPALTVVAQYAGDTKRGA
eukprot:2333158-Rhodomonas_salina.1